MKPIEFAGVVGLFVVVLAAMLIGGGAVRVVPERGNTQLPMIYAKQELIFQNTGALGYVNISAFILDKDRYIRIYKDADLKPEPQWYVNVRVMRTDDGACVDFRTIPLGSIGYSRWYNIDQSFQVENCDLTQFFGWP